MLSYPKCGPHSHFTWYFSRILLCWLFFERVYFMISKIAHSPGFFHYLSPLLINILCKISSDPGPLLISFYTISIDILIHASAFNFIQFSYSFQFISPARYHLWTPNAYPESLFEGFKGNSKSIYLTPSSEVSCNTQNTNILWPQIIVLF